MDQDVIDDLTYRVLQRLFEEHPPEHGPIPLAILQDVHSHVVSYLNGKSKCDHNKSCHIERVLMEVTNG